jgi:hypothetical protein
MGNPSLNSRSFLLLTSAQIWQAPAAQQIALWILHEGQLMSTPESKNETLVIRGKPDMEDRLPVLKNPSRTSLMSAQVMARSATTAVLTPA